jgi:hypothetical protein
MICRNCGAEIPADSLFCTHCGERPDAGQMAPPPEPQPQYATPGAPYPYGAQPVKKPPLSKKMKAIIFGGAGAVVLAVVLILVFTLGAGGGGPLSGKSIQTKFVNESVKFLTQVTDDFRQVDTSKAATQPFELTAEMSADSGYGTSDYEIAMVYDKLALGIALEGDYQSFTILLLEDILYVQDSYGSVQAIEFDTKEKLDSAMTLQDRFKALQGSVAPDVDWKKLAEILVNSIPEDCFEKTNSGFTMTLDTDALVDTLNNFSNAIKDEDDLNNAFKDLSKQISGSSMKLSSLADMAASAVEGYGSSMDFELVWEIGYSGNTPASMTVSYEDGSEYNDFTLEMTYTKASGGNELEATLETASGYSDFSLEMTTTKVSGGIEFEGTVKTKYEKISFEGAEMWDGKNFSLTIDADTKSGGSYSVELEGTITYGAPKKEVESDRRFKVDTKNAYEIDLSDLY